MNPAVRLARPDDVPAIRALVESAYRGESARAGWTHEADLLSGERTSEAEVAAIVNAPDQCVLVAEQDGRIVGSVALTALAPGRAYLGMLAVEPGLQGSGLGRGLISAAEKEAQRRFGAATMEMTVIAQRETLIAWYERRGYHRTGERRPFPYVSPETAGLEMVVLQRRLS